MDPVDLNLVQTEDLKRLARIFNRERRADIFIVGELINRIEDYLSKIKQDYENLVEMKREQKQRQIQKKITKKVELGAQLQVIKETSHETGSFNTESEMSKEKVRGYV